MFDNRITRAVAKMDEKLATLDADAIARVEASATLDTGEWVALGDAASRGMIDGVIDGVIDVSSAQTLHVIHTGFRNGEATLAQRLIFMQAACELLAGRIKAAS